MTCTSPEESIPCASSSEFLYLNDRIGKEKELLHTDADIDKLGKLLTRDE